MNPEMAALVQGSPPCSRWERSTVTKSQVRMMSWPWGRRSIGNRRPNRSSSSSHREAICGVIDEVAQVSITSGSPVKPPGLSRWSAVYPSGTSVEGSTGRRSSDGTRGWSWSTAPSSRIGYHTGKGTPKNLWRLMSQSPMRPLTQSS